MDRIGANSWNACNSTVTLPTPDRLVEISACMGDSTSRESLCRQAAPAPCMTDFGSVREFGREGARK